MKPVSVNRMGTLWAVFDGEIIPTGKFTIELREPLDMPGDPDLHLSFDINGQIRYWDKSNKLQTARAHDFGGITEDCVLTPQGVWYHLSTTHLKFIKGAWYATWTGWSNDHLAHMLNAGFWAYRDYYPARWYVRSIYRRVRYAVIRRLSRIDTHFWKKGWRN